MKLHVATCKGCGYRCEHEIFERCEFLLVQHKKERGCEWRGRKLTVYEDWPRPPWLKTKN